MTRLAVLVDRYGEAIEGDLRFYFKMRLLDEFREVLDGTKTARELLVYIDRIPSGSSYAEATGQDDELAEQFGTENVDDTVRPRLLGWTPEVAMTATVSDRLAELTNLVHQVAGGKPGSPVFERRPETALERFRKNSAAAAYDYLIDLVEEARTREE